tara:strand:- start:323 stop:1432 length:1110 start_codon:yes stop_codon:yes gene_type:complete
MSRARDFADLAGSADAGGLTGRNMLINGQHLISQRGTTFSETTAASYTTDRWLRHVGSSFNFDTTITQSTTVPAGTGLTHSLKVEADAAVTPSGSDNAGIGQRIEGDTMKRLAYGAATGKSATLSFWVRSNKTGTYCVMFGMNNGSSTSSEKYLHVKEYTISSADTWEHKTILLPANTTQAITTSTSEGFRIVWWLAVGSSDHVSADSWIQSDSFSATSNQVNFMDSASNEWYLTGCQFEIGEQATPFEHRSFGDELRRCQRYFVNYPDTSDGTNIVFVGRGNGTSQISNCNFPMPVVMRASPTFSTIASLNAIGPSGYNNATNVTPTVQGTPTFEPNLGVSFTGLSGLTDNRLAGAYIFSPFSINAEL